MMGGVKIDAQCRTSLPGLFAAGEDAGGTHGANRLGGNGVANSTVFGEISGEVMAGEAVEAPLLPFDPGAARRAEAEALSALGGDGSPYPIRAALKDLMWEKVGLRRTAARLREAVGEIESLRERAARTRAGDGRAYNLAWQHVMDVRNQLAAADLIARSALERDESRGSHHRDDFPETRPVGLYNIFLRKEGAGVRMERRPVRFTRLRPGEASAAKAAPVSSSAD
jgi:succinate dehydrogenase/fumarate reductase flavoprotein subunit